MTEVQKSKDFVWTDQTQIAFEEEAHKHTRSSLAQFFQDV